MSSVNGQKGSFIILSSYMDDILLTKNDNSSPNSTKESLTYIFDIKYVGDTSYILVVFERIIQRGYLACHKRPTLTRSLNNSR